MTYEQKEQRRLNWQNRQVKRLGIIAKSLNLPNEELHFGICRSTWATQANRNAGSTVSSVGVGHLSEETTRKNYFAEESVADGLFEVNEKLANLHKTLKTKKGKIALNEKGMLVMDSADIPEIMEDIRENFMIEIYK
jgi:hypothetical protein